MRSDVPVTLPSGETFTIPATRQVDLDWLKFLPAQKEYSIVVCSCGGEKIENDYVDEIIYRDNFGREAGNYLHFIIEKYEYLSDVMVFLQADPWCHGGSYHNPNVLLELFYGTPKFTHPICYLNQDYNGLAIPVFGNEKLEKALSLVWKDRPIGKNIPSTIGAQFYANKSTVLNHPIDSYVDLYNHAKDKTHYPSDPYGSMAHTLEIFWGSVFDHESK